MHKLFFLFFTLLSLSVYGKITEPYLAIVDAGSSGSRIYLYKYSETKPFKVTEIASRKVEPGISSIDMNKLDEYIEDLLDVLEDSKIDRKDVSFNLMATAGMRTLSVSQQERIYAAIRKLLTKNHININYVGTIPGSTEGGFEWMSINYLEETLDNPEKSYGHLGLGGASMQIAFYTKQQMFDKNAHFKFIMNDKEHRIYSKSYLGLGADLARSQYLNEPSCFYRGYPLPDGSLGSGVFDTAVEKIKSLVNDVHKVKTMTPDLPALNKFIATSAFYYNLTSGELGFKSKKLTLNAIKNKSRKLGLESWPTIKEKYDNDKYLYTQYFNSALIYTLLTYGFGFETSQEFEVIDKVGNMNMTWTIGACIYLLNGNEMTKEQSEEIELKPAA